MNDLVFPSSYTLDISNPELIIPYVRFEPYTTNFSVIEAKLSGKKSKKENEDFGTVEKIEGEDTLGLNNDSMALPSKVTSIILPMPSKITDSLSGSFSQVEGLALLKSSLGGYIKWKAVKKLAEGFAVPAEIGVLIKQKVFGGGVDNPHDELLYNGHDRRDFSFFDYTKLQPESKEEEDVFTYIFNIFRMNSIGAFSDVAVIAPCSWNIEFYVGDFLVYEIINAKISQMESSLGGEGERFNFMASKRAVSGFSLTFKEMNRSNRKNVLVNI